MSNKCNLFSDQSSSSRVNKLKRDAINLSASFPNSGLLHKNNTEHNSVINALSRVRGGGYVVPSKVVNRVTCDIGPNPNLTDCSEEIIYYCEGVSIPE